MLLGEMPLINDYSLCNQTVTVYHEDGGQVARTVHPRAYLSFKRTENVDRTGSSEASSFLLVVPGGELACRTGDKVLLGVGPEVPEDAARWWRTFVPSKVDNLVVVRHVDPHYFGGRMVHTEAGG